MQMQPAVWQLVSLRSESDRRRLLDSFGIMVVPAPQGEFEHNAALNVVSSDGRLVRIIDYQDFKSALDEAVAITQRDTAARSQNLQNLRAAR